MSLAVALHLVTLLSGSFVILALGFFECACFFAFAFALPLALPFAIALSSLAWSMTAPISATTSEIDLFAAGCPCISSFSSLCVGGGGVEEDVTGGCTSDEGPMIARGSAAGGIVGKDGAPFKNWIFGIRWCCLPVPMPIMLLIIWKIWWPMVCMSSGMEQPVPGTSNDDACIFVARIGVVDFKPSSAIGCTREATGGESLNAMSYTAGHKILNCSTVGGSNAMYVSTLLFFWLVP